MKTVKYTGGAHVRFLSISDIKMAFGLDVNQDLVANRGVIVVVSDELADALAGMEPVEFEIVGNVTAASTPQKPKGGRGKDE